MAHAPKLGLLFLLACHGAGPPPPPAGAAESTHAPAKTEASTDAALAPAAAADGAAPTGSGPLALAADAGAEAAATETWPPPSKGFVAKVTSDVCLGSCPVYTVTVQDDGAFVVAVASPRKGCVAGKATLTQVGKIEALARSAELSKMRPVYETSQHDRRWWTTTITLGGRTHKVRRWGSSDTEPAYGKLIAIEDAIEEATHASTLADTATLTPCPKER
ncbi:MAG: hypothetical protein JNL38_37115 [Myxococcales bacterium]|nr:hypothetical protein [Myxococcales bacterium]